MEWGLFRYKLQVSGVSGLRGPSHGHPIHLLPRTWTMAGTLGLWDSVGPQTGQVTLEGLNGSKMKRRWLEEDYNMGKCRVKNRAF